MKPREIILHPTRYKRNGIEVWDIEKAFAAPESAHVPHFVEHLRFGALEYILRAWDKGGVEDFKKAHILLGRIVAEMDGSLRKESVNG